LKTIDSQATSRCPVLRLLVLVPHRDARRLLHAWSASLFAAGLHGAWSFPWVAPLAVTKRPIAGAELKALARSLREHVNQCGGKCVAGPPGTAALPVAPGSATLSVFGPSLNMEPPGSFFEASGDTVLCRISPPVVGAAVVQAACNGHLRPDPPHVSFRAAALANMSLRPLPGCGWDGYSFEWKIGALQWLPKN
jgi:hypothetical protein